MPRVAKIKCAARATTQHGRTLCPSHARSFDDAVRFDASRDLRLACAKGDLETVKKEIRKGRDVDLADPVSGWTAMHYAALHAQPECIQALLDAGAKHSEYTNKEYAAGSSVTPLDYAKRYAHPTEPTKSRHPEVIALLEAANAKAGIHVESPFQIEYKGGVNTPFLNPHYKPDPSEGFSMEGRATLPVPVVESR